jgi:diaminopimelate decarboxylase
MAPFDKAWSPYSATDLFPARPAGRKRRLAAMISGCHSGPNPAPGVGMARSLRVAYPDCFLVGKDQSTQSSGLHSGFFDEIWVTPAWNEISLDLHYAQIVQRVREMDGYYLPGSDLEARWLARESEARILNPPLAAFERTAKPFEKIAGILPARVPDFIALDVGARNVYNFAVAHDWDLWAKGPVMDAYRVSEWTQLQSAHMRLTSIWGRQAFFLQHHVSGQDVTVAFAAYDGRLLGTAFMEKRLLTDEGKCWSGEVGACPPELEAAIAKLVCELDWTGGGEIEFVRSPSGELWLIDWNYRFPAWIHGATIAGINLPARLIEAASGLVPLAARCESRQFSRIVLETPVLESFPLPGPPPPHSGSGGVSSKLSVSSPSALPQLMRCLFGPQDQPAAERRVDRRANPALIEDRFERLLRDAAEPSLKTPARVLLPDIAEERLRLTAEAASAAYPLRLRPAYSVKTNPDRRLLDMARRQGFLAETISAGEARWARHVGFPSGDVVYNGPVSLDPAVTGNHALHAVFADSLESFHRLCDHGAPLAETMGMRLNAFNGHSRFGIDMTDADRFADIADAISDRLPGDVRFGIHHHVQSSVVGLNRWLKYTRAAVELAKSLEYVSGRPVRSFDLGGGWESEGFVSFLSDHLPALLNHIHERLTHVDEVIIEPGKAICEQSSVLISRVIEVRDTKSRRDVVADACLSEIPLAAYFPRDVYRLSANGCLSKLPFGEDRILGRVCMEHDILAAAIDLPPETAEGDFLIFSHAGAYEASMSFTFGVGGYHA